MRVGSFSVMIPEGKERETGHVVLEHGTQYRLRLGNHHHRRCDALVLIDGKEIGMFRVNAGSSVTLECSALDKGKFTFFKADSKEGEQVGSILVATSDRGLVQVTFKVEKKQNPHQGMTYDTATLRSRGPGGQSMVGSDYPTPTSYEGEMKTCGGILTPQNFGMAAGVTGLTGQSNQSFYEVPNLDYDPAEETVISLRLVADVMIPRPLTTVPKSNPVPNAVR